MRASSLRTKNCADRANSRSSTGGGLLSRAIDQLKSFVRFMHATINLYELTCLSHSQGGGIPVRAFDQMFSFFRQVRVLARFARSSKLNSLARFLTKTGRNMMKYDCVVVEKRRKNVHARQNMKKNCLLARFARSHWNFQHSKFVFARAV